MFIHHLISFISSHGICDIFKPLWFPIYSASVAISLITPLQYLNISLLIGTIYHFSDDLNLTYQKTSYIMMPLIVFKENRNVQNMILGYISIIHTPISYYNISQDKEFFYWIPLCLTTYVSTLKIPILRNTLHDMIYKPGKELKNKYLQKIFIGIINAHVILHGTEALFI